MGEIPLYIFTPDILLCGSHDANDVAHAAASELLEFFYWAAPKSINAPTRPAKKSPGRDIAGIVENS